ncbi:pyridoxamine 5'-phosphate oxidase family protein [Sciscionella sediminilitoris]|uniref:pyridoxamine 5'-phosphate oxidase family protein n=1 Tax=Sciscionella sediminilitoris TaxID=1445613 RepID=UPI0004DF994B|nr:pyridoxamine 5'-phosphate oxidase family protein [Sciscionella sp. SE31]
MRELPWEECLRLLRKATIGRLVFTKDALPAIRPVEFLVQDEDILVRTTADGALGRLADTVVAFEADSIDEARRSGWSVVAVGMARRIEDAEEQRALSCRLRAAGARDLFIRIPVQIITGRYLEEHG